MNPEAPGEDSREGRRVQRARALGGSRSAQTPPILQVGCDCSACPLAEHMALRGVYARLLNRGPGLQVFRSWSSATAQTGQCWTWGGMGREKLEGRELGVIFPVLCLQRKARRPRVDRPSVRTPGCAPRPTVPSSNCPRWVLSQNPRAAQEGGRAVARARGAEAVSFPRKPTLPVLFAADIS